MNKKNGKIFIAMEQASRRSGSNILKDRKGEIAELVNILGDDEIPEFPVNASRDDSARTGLLLATNRRADFHQDHSRDSFYIRISI